MGIRPFQPWLIHWARIVWPEPPFDPSRLRIRNAPGPTFSRSRVVWPEHGSGLHWSISSLWSIPNGAAYCAAPRPPVRAAAFDAMLTESTEKTCAKKPGAERDSVTLIVSFGRYFEENETCGAGPPFVCAYWAARSAACAGFSGSACAPASAAESAIAWRSRLD